MRDGVFTLDDSMRKKTRAGASGPFGAKSPAPGVCRLQGPSSDTLIIFDWDDTLLCSSDIRLGQWTAEQLKQLELVVETILKAAMNLGETLIVTNGNKSWVQDSARRFLPKLVPLLNRMTVMSARAMYEERWPGNPFAWKINAFQEILATRESIPEPAAGTLNLIVLGDSLWEIEAAHIATSNQCNPSCVKTLKFKEFPSVTELLGEIRAATQMLPEIVNRDSGCNKALVPCELPTHLEYLSSWASGWKASDQILSSSFELSFPVALAGG